MNRLLLTPLAVVATIALTQTAKADVTTFNASLTDPPGVYFGTGNSNSGFTVDTANGIELGLSAIHRFIGPYTPSGNVYQVDLGDSSQGGSAWGVDISINLQLPGGGSSLTLNQIDAVLTVTDERTGFTQTLPGFLSTLAGNTCFGPGGVDTTCASPSTQYGIQNSEPGSLLAAIGDVNFNDAISGVYDVTLAVYGCSTTACTTNLLASDTIQIAAPEPATWAILGVALLALGGAYQRRRGGLFGLGGI